jgi:hypothetical protein
MVEIGDGHDPATCDPGDVRRARLVREALISGGLFDASDHGPPAVGGGVARHWRVAVHPFLLSRAQLATFEALGNQLLAFYGAWNQLYHDSAQARQAPWIARYLDAGKPDAVVRYGRMNRLRPLVPHVIRPDFIATERGLIMTELDSVPGGIGLTAAMSRAYGGGDATLSWPGGGSDGMVAGFARMLRGVQRDREGCVAIVVSDESNEYRPEMMWLATALREAGLDAACVHPRDVSFTEDGLWIAAPSGPRRVAVIYRFFELFDLPNIPKSDLILYSAKGGKVEITPACKPALEEKLALALLHHPVLEAFWRKSLGDDAFEALSTLVPKTWVLDPTPIPPTAVIPGLFVGGRVVNDWSQLASASQRERQFVVKPSGFSELAWGSRGVSIGHDLSEQDWRGVIETALASHATSPYVLQQFHKGRQIELPYLDGSGFATTPLRGRVRLSPYYFVVDGRAELAGILGTLCPLDKKVIHGMRDAIMAPCAVSSGQRSFGADWLGADWLGAR